MDDHEQFLRERAMRIAGYEKETELNESAQKFLEQTLYHQYSYNFEWMGLPVIQYPQDLIMLQEIIWKIKPDLIIETGIARGGSLVFYASMLALLGGNRKVLGIDINFREHNKVRLLDSPVSPLIQFIEGSSVDMRVVEQVKHIAKEYKTILLCLDSNHTHQHVLKELILYTPLVTKGSYCIVFDTIIEEMPKGYFNNRPWDMGDNPKTAVREFLKNNEQWKIDRNIDNKLQVSAAKSGYLIKN